MVSADLICIMTWWGMFFAVGIINIPLSFVFFKKFIDGGYGFSKTIGLVFLSYLIFVGNIYKAFPFSRTTIFGILFFVLLLNVLILRKSKKAIFESMRVNKWIIVLQEFLFTLGLFGWSWVRAHQPNIAGLEKFMDLGFINSILRTEYFPPTDMWFAGNSINYYWFGHFMTAVVTKLSNIPSSITYNLMLATILGLAMSSAFSFSATLTTKLKNIKKKRVAIAAGLISAILLTFAGNFHTPVYTYLEDAETYWYPDATRFIGYNPDVEDKTIHEFPHYSFVVSDLHAHLIDFPVVLLYVALLFNFVSKIDKETKNKKQETKISKQFRTLNFNIWNLFVIGNLKFIISQAVPLGIILGIMFMTNAWDTANYLLLTGFAILFFWFSKERFGIKTIINTTINLIPIILIAALTVMPFLANFESIAQGVDFVNARSRLWQLAVLWGFPAILFAFFVNSISKKKVSKQDWFVFAIFVTATVLIIIPEIIYVKDIYIASHHRANTMFKLTYQSFVMTYLISGYVAAKSITYETTMRGEIIKKLFFVGLFAAVLLYPKYSINSYYNELKVYKGLSGETWVSERYPGEYEAVLWLRENTEGQPVILEAPGDSYTDYNVISSYTGLPTVSGWFVHEWLWRGDSKFPQERVNDINLIYTSSDIELTKRLLKKYSVEYVIIGHFEREKYPNLNEEKFGEVGGNVFGSQNTSVYNLFD